MVENNNIIIHKIPFSYIICFTDYCSYGFVYYSTLSASSWLPTREPNKAELDGMCIE